MAQHGHSPELQSSSHRSRLILIILRDNEDRVVMYILQALAINLKHNPSQLYLDPDLARFYEVNDHDRQDFKVILDLANKARNILDLGCGTGVLSSMLARTGNVVGVDPAKAMLDIGRERYLDSGIKWIEGDARNVTLDQKFDFIVMSGHVFQVFLTQVDQLAVLSTVFKHLTRDGILIFDSRNPNFPGSKERTRAHTRKRFTHSTLGEVEMWNESKFDTNSGILTYSNGFKTVADSEAKSATEKIKYTPKDELFDLISRSGLEVRHCYGDWELTPFSEFAMEIIPVCSR